MNTAYSPLLPLSSKNINAAQQESTASAWTKGNIMNVSWVKCSGGNWCPLETLNLDSVGDTAGVYMIWHSGNPGRVVRIGQGVIKDRLSAHRNDKAILAYNRLGTLHVTWAAVSWSLRDGVERHLADTWKPLVGSAFPDVQPIAVNSPWS